MILRNDKDKERIRMVPRRGLETALQKMLRMPVAD